MLDLCFVSSVMQWLFVFHFSLQSLPFQKIQHSITAQDHQPTPDSCILSMVVGQLKVNSFHSAVTNAYILGFLRDTKSSKFWKQNTLSNGEGILVRLHWDVILLFKFIKKVLQIACNR